MRKLTKISPSVPVALLVACMATSLRADRWPQFRGPNASGVASKSSTPPVAIGPDENVIWKADLGFGHSSPVVAAGRVYVTAVEGEELFTIALDAKTGSLVWKRKAPASELERIHRIGSRAQPSCATDGDVVVSFFGSSGLHAYNRDGSSRWSLPMGPFKNGFGAGSSPIIVGDRVILAQDHDTDSFLLCVDKKTGNEIWRADRSEFPRGFSTPVVHESDGKKQIVVAGTLRIIGYDLKTGDELWTVRGASRIVNTTPVFGDDGTMYFACWSPGADPGDRIQAQPFEELLAQHDDDSSGTLEASEIPEGPLSRRFDQIDRDKNDTVTETEYDYMKGIFTSAQNVCMAVKPGREGDVTASHILWQERRYLPYVPSPLLYRDVLFTVKNGGIVASIDPATGEHHKVARVSGRGDYYASPIGAAGKVYLLSERGMLSIIEAKPQWEEISSVDFGERCYATPAVVGDRLYLRTASKLYCFGAK